MTVVRFTVPGIPAPQGSKTRWGAEDNPRTKPWRAALSSAAEEARGELPLLAGAVLLRVDFHFPRPKSHYGARGLKASAPEMKSSTPDLDKLVRAVGDSLKGVVLRDDSQVAWVIARKLYAEHAFAWVEVESIEEAA